MDMSPWTDFIRRQVETLLVRMHPSETMVATSYNPQSHAVRGIVVPHGVETGWVPISTPMAGAGYGVVVGPEIGSGDGLDGNVFHMTFEQGDQNLPRAHGRTFSAQDPPPVAQSGEVVMQGKWGGGVKLAVDKSVTISGTAGSITVHNPDGSITHTDSAGGIIHQANGKIYLGSKTASSRVMLEGNVPSNHIYGIA